MDNFQKLFVRIRRGGNDAIAAAWELSAIAIDRLREERRWIPVAERLPERDNMGNPAPVLVVMPGYGGRTIGYCDNDEYGVRWQCESTQNPTHWQPLPPPPKATT